ncbi:short chain dehydrogenase domain-containing protein [Cordyceps javanica]|nr:short chain dehydrogenase domain-containing protein [Cordyceps javanica]
MAEKAVVFITGANSGIGYETVRALVEQTAQTYHVYLGSRSVEKGNEAASALRAEFPETTSVIEVIQIDVSSDESIDAAYETVKAQHGYIDVLVNNAGMRWSFSETPPPPFFLPIANVQGQVHHARGVEPNVRRQRHGRPDPDADVCASATGPVVLVLAASYRQGRRSAAALRDERAGAARDDAAGLLPGSRAGGRVAQAEHDEPGWVPVEQDGAQHDDAGVALEPQGGRGPGLERVAGVPGDESGGRQGAARGARSGAPVDWRRADQEGD